MTETNNHVPGPNEPDPDNVRMRSWDGGTDGIPDAWGAKIEYPPGFQGTGGQSKKATGKNGEAGGRPV